MFRQYLLTLLLVASPVINAEQISYEIYSFETDPYGTLIAKGVKDYSVSDVQVIKKEHRGEVHWSKILMLDNGFGISGSIYREPEITGFGLSAEGSECSFSWEWFNIIEPGKYKKLQETGQITAKYNRVDSLKEISEIYFDTDISLRLNESKEVGRDTHRILIRKGSVLKFPPNAFHGTVALSRPCP